MKKFILVSLTVLLGVSLFMAGCGDAEGGAAGSTGSPGTGGSPGTDGSPGKVIATVSGNQSAAGVQVAIDSADEVIVTGDVTITGATPIIVKTGKKLRLAAGLELAADGALVIQDETGVSGKGAITGDSGGSAYLVAPPAVTAEYEGDQYITPVPLLAVDDEEFDASAAVLGVRGPLTIDGPMATAIGAKGVFVTGAVTVEAALTGAATIVALGNVTITEAQSQAVVWGVGGDLDAQDVPTDGAGTITVGGNAVFKEAHTAAITGAVVIGKNAEFKAGLATGGALTIGGTLDVTGAADFGGALIVKGTTTFESTVESDNVALTFGGPVEFKDDVTRETGGAYSFGGDVTIADGGTITLGGATGVGLKKGKSIKAGNNVALTAAGGDVVITPVTGAILTATETGAKIAASTAHIEVTSGTLAVSGELEATDKNITFKVGTGTLAINAGGKVTTKAAVDNGAIILGTAATNGVTLTGEGSWTAGGSGVYLTNTAAKATLIGKIGSAAATLTATGEPTITVIAGSDAANVLTLSAGVTINVGGTGETLGAVVLTKGSGATAGTLKLTDATSIVKTGNTGDTAYATGVKQTKVAVVTTLGTTVTVMGTSGDKIVSVAGKGDGNGTIAAATDGNISIDGGTTTTDAAS